MALKSLLSQERLRGKVRAVNQSLIPGNWAGFRRSPFHTQRIFAQSISHAVRRRFAVPLYICSIFHNFIKPGSIIYAFKLVLKSKQKVSETGKDGPQLSRKLTGISLNDQVARKTTLFCRSAEGVACSLIEGNVILLCCSLNISTWSCVVPIQPIIHAAMT